MRIEGQYLFSGSPQLVWSLLHDSATICSMLPNCEGYDQIGPHDYVVTWLVRHGPLKGHYIAQVNVSNEAIYERVALAFKGEGPDGIIRGEGTVYLEQAGETTVVQHEGELELFELSGNISSRLVRTLANAIIRQYFEAVSKQIQIQTGIHTTQLANEELGQRRTGAVSLQETLAEIRQDRQTIWVVLAFLTLISFTLTSVIVLLFLFGRWGKRTYDRRVAEAVREQQSGNSSLSNS